MCEFCLKHGEGKKWYLQAENYADELLRDVRRRQMVAQFFADPEELRALADKAGKLERTPRFVRNAIGKLITHRMKKEHFGQVVPIEEVEEIFKFVNSVVRMACVCRHVTLGRERRYCYGFSLSPDGGEFARILRGLDSSFLAGPDSAGVESVSKEETLEAFLSHEHEGLCHTVWSFRAPFIGGVCNCDRSDCLAMQFTVTHSTPVMFRAEYVAEIDPDLCVGCRECMRVCGFGAMMYSPSNQKAIIDQRWCYGCGICRAVCKKVAIRLRERAEVPVAAQLW